MYLITEITIITNEILNYYKSNIEEAKYQYNLLISTAQSRGLDKKTLNGYYEIHHIIPRSFNGSNDEDNLVLLTYREHVLAHMLLYLINSENKDMFLAFSLLTELKSNYISDEELSVNLEALEVIKIKRSEFMKGKNNPMKNPETAKKVSELKKHQPGFFKGHHHTEKTKQILRNKTLNLGWSGENHPFYGRKHTEESRKKISDKLKGENHPLFGKHLSDETREKMSKSRDNPIISPEGIEYSSIKAAAKEIGISRQTLSRWIKENPEKGWKKK